jgi:hypothetical protein
LAYNLTDITEERTFTLSPTYRALGYAFTMQCNDVHLADYLDSLFEQFRSTGQPDSTYTLAVVEDRGSLNYLVYCNDQMLDNHRKLSVPLSTLLWHINRSVVRSSQDRLLIHASAVSLNQVALLFPAAMESGKSTLAAGLVRRGFDYITDEVVAMDLESGSIEPFPRALSIDRGSWEVLSDLRPDVSSQAARYRGNQWQVRPSSIRDDCIAGSSTPRFVVTPAYVENARTELQPLARADGLRILAEHSFNFFSHGAGGLRVLAQVVRRSDCYHLQMSDLDEACQLVLELVGEASGNALVSDLEPISIQGGGCRVW